jgi:hypothetical protein
MQQNLGRRLDRHPYYIIVERLPDRLVLESRPDANRPLGLRRALGGALLLLAAIALFFAGFAWNAQALGGSFGGVVLGALAAGLLGGAGYRRLIGGIAIASTRNRVVADRLVASIIYSQRARIGGERQQSLPFSAVEAVLLREQGLLSGSLIQRRIRIAVLGLQTHDHGFWIVDSAADAAQLEDLKAAFEEILGEMR